MSRRNLIIGTTILIFMAGGLGYWLYTHSNTKLGLDTIFNTEGSTNAWKAYESEAWSGYENRISFSYPPTWNLAENKVNGSLDSITLSSSDYEVIIDRKGRGASSDWSERDIGGYSARVWETQLSTVPLGSVPEDGLDYSVTLGVIEPGFIIRARTSDSNKKLLNEFLSTIEFAITQ